MDIDFGCTSCGNCCHDLKLPLTACEAVAWLADGHRVQILCEAVPRSMNPTSLDARQLHRSQRSFEALSGALPIRVTAILAASFEGPCPNLGAANVCAIYARRPLVCRIYPAEISPFIELDPSLKGCPPEAWAPRRTAFMRGGVIVDHEVAGNIAASREADRQDVLVKQRLCMALGVDVAALAGEGVTVHEPDPSELHRLLQHLRLKPAGTEAAVAWRLLSNKESTVRDLTLQGAVIDTTERGLQGAWHYIGFSQASSTPAGH